MKLRKYSSVLLVILILLSIMLSGCSGKVEASFQQITVNLGDEPATLDPQQVFDVTPMRVVNAIFEGLCRIDEKGTPIAGAAESWDISDDKLTYIFHIREDAKWWDGTDVTAEDFKQAWLRALDPEPADYAPAYMGNMLFCINGAKMYATGEGKREDVGVFARDAKTLEITLESHTPYFLKLVCGSVFMPVNTNFYEKQPVQNNMTLYGTGTENIMGNGPFKLKDWNHGEYIVLEKNPMYWNSKGVKLDQVTFKMISNSSSAFTSFLAGEIDVADITEPSQKMQINKKNSRLESYDLGATQYISINNEDEILKNKNIRKALAYAIDRETLTQKVLNDGSEKALGFVNPVVRWISSSFREEAGDLFIDNDIGNAKKLLSEGLRELNLSKLPEMSILIDDKETSKRDAQALQDMWRKSIGLEVEIVVLPFDAMIEKMFMKDYQMGMLMWMADFNDPTAFLDIFESDNFFNVAFYNNPDYDSLMIKAKNERDDFKRLSMMIEAEKTVIDDMVVCPVYFLRQNYVVNSGVRDFVRGSSPMQDMDFYWTHIE